MQEQAAAAAFHQRAGIAACDGLRLRCEGEEGRVHRGSRLPSGMRSPFQAMQAGGGRDCGRCEQRVECRDRAATDQGQRAAALARQRGQGLFDRGVNPHRIRRGRMFGERTVDVQEQRPVVLDQRWFRCQGTFAFHAIILGITA